MLTRCGWLAALPLFVATASAQPAVVINEYRLAALGGPFGLVAGPIANGSDGALWFPVGHPGFQFSSYEIYRITTAGVSASYGSGNGCCVGGITAGPDGALWYAINSYVGIGRLTTSGVLTSFPLTNADAPATSITTGPDGALWFTESLVNAAHGSAIGQITTAGAFTQYLLPNASVEPTAIAAGSDGALWFTEDSPGIIGRITTSGTMINQYPVPSGSTLTGIAAGPDGALWFTESSAGKIGRITAGGALTEYPVPVGSPQSIAAGPDGALWFTTGAYIGRITTAGVVTEYPVPTAGFSAAGITAGSDGAMWFTASNALYFEIGQAVINPNPVPAILSITITDTGNFSRGQTNAAYTLTVSNQQAASPTSGLVTVTDNLPPGLSLVSMGGTGWNCAGTSCTRADAIMGGAAYPPITVTVDVAANAGSPAQNYASVFGGGSGNSSAQDSTIINPNPSLISIAKTHTGTFAQGQMNAVYTLTVSNQGGPTDGLVLVTEMPPAGLTVVSMAGTGWNCGDLVCARNDALNGNSSYPAITVMVNVAADASSPQVNQASVSGGGAASVIQIADSTVITGSQPPSFFAGEANLGSGVYFLTFPNNTLFGYYEHLAGSFIYHYDMGFEYVSPANDANGDVYFYDFTSGHWWYTGPALFPNLYDFTLQAWIYYSPDPLNPGHYTTNPRKFAYDTTHTTFIL